jgi:hypothetical protein
MDESRGTKTKKEETSMREKGVNERKETMSG